MWLRSVRVCTVEREGRSRTELFVRRAVAGMRPSKRGTPARLEDAVPNGNGMGVSVRNFGQKRKGGPGDAALRFLQTVLVDSKALKSFMTNFLLVYNIRAGIAVLLRLVRLVLQKPRDMLSLTKLVGETHLHFRIEAVRMGLFIGGFTGIYRAVCHGLAVYVSKGLRERWHAAVGGWLAGLSLYFMDSSWHRTLSLYMATRAVQCAYNYAKFNGYWHFWGSDWDHGDALLFTLSSAQIMYAYVMRPETLPANYYKFIVRQGPIDEVILQGVRDNNRGKPIDLPAMTKYIKETGGDEAWEVCKKYLYTDNPLLIPCRALHPYTVFCSLSSLKAFQGTAQQIFPVYLSLALVPAVVLRFKNFVKEPLSVVGRSLFGAAQSTMFLAGFCGGYQAVICVIRHVLENRGWKDHKLNYYFAGLIASLSILIERKSRRSELALYAFPRALDSLYMILYDHQMAFRIPQGEAILFCCAMGSVMWFFENEEQCLSPLVSKLLERFVPQKTSRRALLREDTDEDTDDMSSVNSNPRDPMIRNRSVISLSGGYTMGP